MSGYVQLVEVCEDAWKAIQKFHPDVPEAVVVVGSGGRRASTLYGHFAPDRWTTGSNTVHEVLIVAEQLHRGARDVFTTLLHEAVHGVANTREIKDVSGVRHNKKFRNLCEELGMDPPENPDRRLGFSAATIDDNTAWIFKDQIEAIESALNLCRVIVESKEVVKSSWAAVCGCDRKIRVGKKIYNPDVTPDINIVCTLCGGEFVVEDDDE